MEITTQQNTQQSVEEQTKQNSNSELLQRKPIEGTPFEAVNTGEGWFLTLGKYKLTDKKEDIVELLEETKVKETNWEFLITTMSVIIESILTEKNSK